MQQEMAGAWAASVLDSYLGTNNDSCDRSTDPGMHMHTPPYQPLIDFTRLPKPESKTAYVSKWTARCFSLLISAPPEDPNNIPNSDVSSETRGFLERPRSLSNRSTVNSSYRSLKSDPDSPGNSGVPTSNYKDSATQTCAYCFNDSVYGLDSPVTLPYDSASDTVSISAPEGEPVTAVSTSDTVYASVPCFRKFYSVFSRSQPDPAIGDTNKYSSSEGPPDSLYGNERIAENGSSCCCVAVPRIPLDRKKAKGRRIRVARTFTTVCSKVLTA